MYTFLVLVLISIAFVLFLLSFLIQFHDYVVKIPYEKRKGGLLEKIYDVVYFPFRYFMYHYMEDINHYYIDFFMKNITVKNILGDFDENPLRALILVDIKKPSVDKWYYFHNHSKETFNIESLYYLSKEPLKLYFYEGVYIGENKEGKRNLMKKKLNGLKF